MPHNPQWAIDYAKQRGGTVPVQYTIQRMHPQAAPAQASQQFQPITLNAGAGPDGIVQPNQPAVLDTGTSPHSVYHEGEPITVNPNGVRNITPFQTIAGGAMGGAGAAPQMTPAQQQAMGAMMQPRTVHEQYGLGQMQSSQGLPGYKDGGTTFPSTPPPPTTVADFPNNDTLRKQQGLPPATLTLAPPSNNDTAEKQQGLPAATISGSPSATIAGTPNKQSGVSTLTAAPNTSSPATLSTLGADAVRTGLQMTTDTAQGKNPYLQTLGTKQLTSQGAASAVGNAAQMSALARQGASSAIKNTVSQEMARSSENAQGTLRNSIYDQQQNAALNAQGNLVNQGQQVRTYEDITIPQSDATLKTMAQNIEATQLGMDSTRLNMDSTRLGMDSTRLGMDSTRLGMDAIRQNMEAAKQDREQRANSLAEEVANNRAAFLIKAGSNLVDMKGDATLRNAVKSRLGDTATDAQIDAEIAKIEGAVRTENKEYFRTQTDTSINDIIENGGDLNSVLSNESILRDIAGLYDLDLSKPEGMTRVKEIAAKRHEEMSKPEAVRVYDNIVENIINPTMPGLVDNPEFKADMLEVIGDILIKNGIEYADDGTPIISGTVDWPWEAPDTYFKYNDWNGNAALGGKYDETQQLSIGGNGTTYLTSSGKAVTMADMNKIWNSPTMSTSDREKYFDTNGAFKMERFLADKGFKQNTGGDFSLSSNDEFSDKFIKDGSKVPSAISNTITLWNSTKNTDKITTGTGDTAQSSNASDGNKFVYKDENGITQSSDTGAMDVQSPQFAYVVYQMSQAAGKDVENGEFLDADSLNLKLKSQDWYIDKSGKVLNLWDKDYKVADSTMLNTVLKQPVNSNGTIPWSGESYKKLSVTPEQLEVISKNNLWNDPAYSGYFTGQPGGNDEHWLENAGATNYFDKSGKDKDRFEMTGEMKKLVNDNAGKLYVSKEGKVYVILGIHDEPKKRYSTSHVRLWDPIEQKEVGYNKATSGSRIGKAKTSGERLFS